MVYAVLKVLHVLGVIFWVGGMLFAHACLRPAVAALPPPQRLPLLRDVLGRFFTGVGVASLVVLATGLGMMWRAVRLARITDTAVTMPIDWWLMGALGTLMVLIFGHIRLVLFRRLDAAVQAQDWPAGGAAMASIRAWVSVNLVLGLLIVVVVTVL